MHKHLLLRQRMSRADTASSPVVQRSQSRGSGRFACCCSEFVRYLFGCALAAGRLCFVQEGHSRVLTSAHLAGTGPIPQGVGNLSQCACTLNVLHRSRYVRQQASAPDASCYISQPPSRCLSAWKYCLQQLYHKHPASTPTRHAASCTPNHCGQLPFSGGCP